VSEVTDLAVVLLQVGGERLQVLYVPARLSRDADSVVMACAVLSRVVLICWPLPFRFSAKVCIASDSAPVAVHPLRAE